MLANFDSCIDIGNYWIVNEFQNFRQQPMDHRGKIFFIRIMFLGFMDFKMCLRTLETMGDTCSFEFQVAHIVWSAPVSSNFVPAHVKFIEGFKKWSVKFTRRFDRYVLHYQPSSRTRLNPVSTHVYNSVQVVILQSNQPMVGN